MKIIVNGCAHDIRAASLAGALEELGLGGGTVVATALNGEFVASASRSDTMLADGDRVEVLAPMQGG
jgi:sulfur carrier protein